MTAKVSRSFLSDLYSNTAPTVTSNRYGVARVHGPELSKPGGPDLPRYCSW